MLSMTFSSEPRDPSFSREKKKQKELQTRPENTQTQPPASCDGKARPYLTLFKKDLTRFWPLWAAYTVLWSLLIPLEVFNRSERLAQQYAKFGLTGWAGDHALQQVCEFCGPVFSAVYGVLCAMAVWSYLYNARSANLTHALPVRREGQFAAHFLSGAAFFVLPHAVVAVLTLIAGLATGSRGDLANILAAMGVLTLLCLFYFSLATLCAFVTGHILALPAFYLIVNFLVYGVAGLLDWLASRFLFGFTSALRGSELVQWLTPVACLNQGLSFEYDFAEIGGEVAGISSHLNGIPTSENGSVDLTVTTRIEGLNLVFIYTAAALVLIALALLLYRRRHLETAGDVVAVSWLRPVFQYGVAFCAALAGSYILVDILGRGNRLLLAVELVVCGVIGYFAARMLLHKTLKVFKSGWKGALIVPAVILVLCLGLEFDVLGVERKIPNADQVVSVWLRGPNSAPGDSASYPRLDVEDPALIEKLLSVHQTIIDHRKELKSALDDCRTDVPRDYNFRDFRVEYILQNGKFLQRDYELPLDPEALEELDDPDSVASALYGLVTDPEFNRLNYGLDDVEADRLTMVLVSGVEGVPEKGLVMFYSPLSELAGYDISQDDSEPVPAAGPAEGPVAETRRHDDVDYRPASLEELAALFRAVEADFDAGDLGKRWLFAYGDEFNANTCAASLEFYWNKKYEEDGRVFYNQERMTIQLTPQAKRTLAALEELGLFENGAFITDYDGEQVWPR